MSFICVDCSPGGKHPTFTDEASFVHHRRFAHDEGKCACFICTPPVGEIEEEAEQSESPLSGLEIMVSLDRRIAAAEARLDSLGSQFVAMAALQDEQRKRIEALEVVLPLPGVPIPDIGV